MQGGTNVRIRLSLIIIVFSAYIKSMSNKERFDQRYEMLGKAIRKLKEALAQPENEFMRDAIIQRFEFTYELSWKTMMLWLANKDIDARNPKDILRAALEQGIIEDGNRWSELHKCRNLTSHNYDESAAKKIHDFVKSEGFALLEEAYKRMGLKDLA